MMEDLSGFVEAFKKNMFLTVNSQNINLKETSNRQGTKHNICIEWCNVVRATEISKNHLMIHYIEQQKKKTLRLKKLEISCNYSSSRTREWILAIQKHCNLVPGRPKKLLVVINPIGGNGKGVDIYQKKISPIFLLGAIETTVVVTERHKHGIQIGKETDFSEYHGIICVGGDGLYQEVIQGYFLQLQKTADVDVNNKDNTFIKPEIPFCLIPAGTFNGIVRYTNDSVIDFETSALRVIQGKVCKLNLLTIHESDKFFGVSTIGFGLGLMTDVMLRADELRWMKKARYPFAFATTILKKRRIFSCHFEYRLCKDLEEEVEAHHRSGEGKTDWIVHSSESNTFASVLISAADVRVNGDTSIMDFFNNTGFLMVDRGSSNIEFIKFAHIFTGKRYREVFPHMEGISNVSGLHLKMSDESEREVISNSRNEELEHYAFIDGEIVHFDGKEFDVRLHKSFVPMFSCVPSGLQIVEDKQE